MLSWPHLRPVVLAVNWIKSKLSADFIRKCPQSLSGECLPVGFRRERDHRTCVIQSYGCRNFLPFHLICKGKQKRKRAMRNRASIKAMAGWHRRRPLMPFATDATWPCARYCHPVMDRACSTPKWENLKKTPKSEIESYNFYESNFSGGI